MNREHPTGTERTSLTKECGWKGGDRGGLAEWEQIHGKKKAKVCLDINRPSEKRVKTGDAGARPSWRSSLLGDPGVKFFYGKLGE
jgi:hypothetical protein